MMAGVTSGCRQLLQKRVPALSGNPHCGQERGLVMPDRADGNRQPYRFHSIPS